ncbi:hypothetical protein WN944_013755 [Citrus x changshan-huyou]|uniref:DUF4378 domain-containing protein n=1 Tax=Citrus x changshan-huyou TaxID=2935761 RepID=A0AAP0M5L2_9ROSI
MALVKTLSMERKPLMLKDYLKDDLSSCSSSGFKSFPRRQCCTTVRFLLKVDLKAKDYNNTKQLLQRSRSKVAASKTISVLQRASGALRNAVKLIPFPTAKYPSSSVQQTQSQRNKKGLALPRSLSRKLLKRSFWRKANEKEGTIKRCKIFREYLEEQHQPSDQITTSLTPKWVSACTTSSKSESNNSWAESDFTAHVLHSSSGNSESSSENDSVEIKNFLQSPDKKPVGGNTVGVPEGEDSDTSSEENRKDWRSEEEKEQFSPVSVLDCPFEDEKDINSPPFDHRLAGMEGTKQKLMQKLRRFESLAQLEPIDLEKRIASFQLDDKFLESSSTQSFENETAKKVQELLKLMKSTSPSNSYNMCKAEDLLSDFFREKLAENKAKTERDLLREAEDWINGQPQELLQGWEVKDGRKAYVNDMEKNGRWSDVNEEEKQEVGLALELEIFNRLMDEFVLDLSW